MDDIDKESSEFKRQRAELIISTFNILTSSADTVDKDIRCYDKIFDRYNELSRKKIPANEMYRRVLERITDQPISVDEAASFREKADNLFLQYTPELLNKDIPDTLYRLCAKGYKLNLASNTGFVEGATLRQSLAELDILKYFSFCIFSDEIDASKPSAYFFEKVHNGVAVHKNQVLHIGDNPKTDYQGAKSFGFDAMLITNPEYKIDDILKYLKQ